MIDFFETVVNVDQATRNGIPIDELPEEVRIDAAYGVKRSYRLSERDVPNSRKKTNHQVIGNEV